MTIASLFESLVGSDSPIAVEAFDGSRTGSAVAAAKLVIRSPNAFRRLATAPGELGLGRAYVAGDIDIEGDIFKALEIQHRLAGLRITPQQWWTVLKLAASAGLRPLPPPPEEARLRGRRHSRARDAAAIAYHYDVSNDFYRLFLGRTMTYSCGLWESADVGLDAAQEAKYELICRKLGLRSGMRLLDVGCGWGGMVMHAAEHHGVEAIGITISPAQVDLASKRVAEAGLADRVQIRLQDYREVDDGPYDAISSIGMFEHVGVERLKEYFASLFELITSEGRLMNHAIGRPPWTKSRAKPGARRMRNSFIERYVFPDGELHEVGEAVSAIQSEGFEIRHLETLREHYALTLRAWVRNLEDNWEEAVSLAGPGRARIWRLYMAGSAVNFERGNNQVHQVLAMKPRVGRSGFPLRPAY